MFLDGIFSRDFYIGGVLQKLLPINFRNGFTSTQNGSQLDVTSQAESLIYSSATVRTLTSATKAQVGADLLALPANYYVSSAKSLRVVVYGEIPNATGSIGIDAYHTTPGIKTLDYAAFVSTPPAGSFIYECRVLPLTSATQDTYARAESNTNTPRIQRTPSTADFTLPQTLRLMAQSASGTITVRRVEVYSQG